MGTIIEHFDTDTKVMTLVHNWEIIRSDGIKLSPIIAKMALDFESNSKYWVFFIPNVDIYGYIKTILSISHTTFDFLLHDNIYIEYGFSDYSERMSSKTLIFTGRILLYIDAILEQSIRQEIVQYGKEKGFYIIIRDKEYAKMKTDLEKPMAFISHDSRDKDDLVRKLAFELSKLMCPVWYDEYSLSVGDSLRENIEKGLKETKKCIIVFSPNFLSNGGWGKKEFDSIFTREIIEKNNIMLPIWHNVTVKDIYEYSPSLADKMALNSSLGVDELAKRLQQKILKGL